MVMVKNQLTRGCIWLVGLFTPSICVADLFAVHLLVSRDTNDSYSFHCWLAPHTTRCKPIIYNVECGGQVRIVCPLFPLFSRQSPSDCILKPLITHLSNLFHTLASLYP
ncbi:hypothetical protein F4604DRAFT_1167472 [Suillus subluteus]|nr:hypothetical protein F4604DRAFT_1167472 [Suillus subluteus]